MELLLSGGKIFFGSGFINSDILIKGSVISSVSEKIKPAGSFKQIELNNLYIIPGFADVHVHLREPGFSYKETIKSGTEAAAKAGYTALCAMPNTNPPADSPENLAALLGLIKKSARVNVYPYAAITRGRSGNGALTDFAALNQAVAFSDDGCGVQDGGLMREAMRRAAELDVLIAAHCEDETLLDGGYIHDGRYAAANGHKGISSESEYRQLARDLKFAAETGCRYHVCHVSAKESVALICEAKKSGVRVTAETAPHYLLLCEDDITDDGRYKMNPPIRTAADRDALLEGISDGTIDVIATDHAPHSAREKSKGLKDSAMGVTGLETAFPVLYTGLVKKGVIPFEKLIELMCVNPRRIFRLGGGIYAGGAADLAVLDTEREYTIDAGKFLSKGKSTPFDGAAASGKNIMTIVGGEIVWRE